MAIKVQCGGCSARYQVKDELAGTLVNCPKCQTRILVPRKIVAGPSPASNQASPAAAPPRAARSEAAPPRPPAARPPAATPKPSRPAPPKPASDEDDEVIHFRKDEDDMPASRPTAREAESEESFELAPVPEPRARTSADRGSIVGGSIAGKSVSGKSAAGQSVSGKSVGGKSVAGKSVAGKSVAGRSTAGGPGASSSRGGQPVDPENRILADDSIKIERDVFVDLLEVKEPVQKAEDGGGFQFSIPALPPILTQVILPWVLSVGCLGWAGYITVMHVLNLPGRAAGLSMVAAALLLYAALLVPLTLKSIHSAAIAAKLRLPNVVWFQTFSLLALPTAGMIIGYDAGGAGSMITLGLLGLAAMCVLMAFMYRADVMQAVLTAFYGASAYIASAALCVAILVGVGLILGKAGMVVPWKSAPAEVAQADKPAPVVAPVAPTTEPVVAPVVVAPKIVEAPVVVQVAPAPIVAAPPPPWVVPVEPITVAAAWPTVGNAIRQSIDVDTPIATAHAVGGAPFVALLQPKSTGIYDLRTGRHTGSIKAAFEQRDLILSPDGKMLAGVETAASQNSTLFPADAVAGAIEIWSTSDNRFIGRVPSSAAIAVPTPLGFAGGKFIASGSSSGLSGLQAWDPATSSIVHQWSTPAVSRSSIAISNSGKFVAVAAGSVVRTFNVQSGEIAGELSAPGPLSQMKGMAFSPDGKTIAAIVPGDSSGRSADTTATLFEWSVANGGKLARSVPIDLAATVPQVNPASGASAPAGASDVAYLQWTPDGRMVRAGSGLFEITSGKAIYTLAAQMSGNLSGQLISVENKRSTYEFLPTGIGTRLVLKTVDLPSAMIDSGVASARAATNELASAGGDGPSTAPATLASSTDGVNAMMMWPSISSTTAPAPAATDQLAAQGQWDVQVKAMVRADPSSRNVLAVLDNGIPVHITTDSDAAAAFVDNVHPGDHIHITGVGEVSEKILLVKMQTGQPIEGK